MWEMRGASKAVFFRIPAHALHRLDDRRTIGLDQDVGSPVLHSEPKAV